MVNALAPSSRSLKRKAMASSSSSTPFPRGGDAPSQIKSTSTTQTENQSQNLFAMGGGIKQHSTSKAARAKRRKLNKTSTLTAPKKSKSTKLQYTHNITFKTLNIGSLLLAVVKEVSRDFALLSLPNGLTGRVNASECCDSLDVNEIDCTTLLQVGQYVRCACIELTSEKKKILLTIRPSVVNAGMALSNFLEGSCVAGEVTSIEDHGYIVNFGVPAVSGFLPFKAKGNNEFCVGMQVTGVVAKVNNEARAVTLTTLSDGEGITKGNKMTLRGLKPGMLVEGQVTEKLVDGVKVKFLGFFEATLKAKIKVGETCKTRIILVDNHTKTVALSSASHILALKPFCNTVKVGEKVQAKIVKVEPKKGITFDSGFCHISRVADKHVPKIDRALFKAGDEKECRVVGVAMFDGVLLLSMQASVLEATVLTYDDCKPGMVVTGKILTIEKFGAIVKLSSHVKGIVTTMHLSAKARAKYKIGAEMKCRVLTVDIEKKKVHLTNLTSLVKCEEVVQSYEQLKAGDQFTGFISNVQKDFFILTGYNNVHGIVRVEGASDAFHIGQVMVTKVVKVNSRRGRLQLSLNTAAKAEKNEFSIGDHVSGTVTEVHEDFFKVGEFLLAKEHLSDDRFILNDLKEGSAIEDAVIIQSNGFISMKPSLLSAKVVKPTVGIVQPAYVTGVKPYGVFVKFLGDYSALCRKSECSDDVVNDLNEKFTLGQSVQARVTQVTDTGKIFVTFKEKKEQKRTKAFEGGEALQGTVRSILDTQMNVDIQNGRGRVHITEGDLTTFSINERYDFIVIRKRGNKLYELGLPGDKKRFDWDGEMPNIGDAVEVVVTSVHPSFVGVALSATVHGSLSGASWKVGERLNVFVSAVNAEKKRVYFTMNSSESSLEVGDVSSAVVTSVSKNAIFVATPSGQEGRVTAKNCSSKFIPSLSASFPIGMKLKVSVLKATLVAGVRRLEFKVVETSKMKFDDIEIGSVHEGRVKRVEKFGVFVTIANSTFDGLAHKSEIGSLQLEIGDQVKVKILRKNEKKKQLSLGLKAEYFSNEKSGIPNFLEEEDSDEDGDVVMEDVEEPLKEEEVSSSSDEEESSSDEEEDPGLLASASTSSTSGLAFDWGDDFDLSKIEEEADESASESESEEEEESSSSKKRKKRKEKKRVEEEIQARELERLNGDTLPTSVDDFEKLILANPDSSYIYVQYIAWELARTEIERARAVAERALKKINFRLEGELLNIWVAYLQLEKRFGTSQSLKSLYQRAGTSCDREAIHSKYISLFSDPSELAELEALLKVGCRKFKKIRNFIEYGEFLLREKREGEAKGLLKKALRILPKREHIMMITKFGISEFKVGSSERGATVFEGLISHYPKRSDLWSLFIDQEQRQISKGVGERREEGVKRIRGLYDRWTSVSLSSKKMKSALKKWLTFEQSFGSNEGIEMCRAKAISFVKKSQEK
eukprot:g1957.t1